MDLNQHGEMDLNNNRCVKGCGFWGSPATNNMCSVCYKKYQKAEINVKSPKSALDVEKPLNPTASNPSIFVDLPVTQQNLSSETATVVSCATSTGGSDSGSGFKKNRCKNCNKKVGLTGFNCRCGFMFCGMHRYPKEHECTFDFKTADRKILAKDNQVVKGDKLETRI